MHKYDSYKDSGIMWIGEIPSTWDICRLKSYCSLKGRIGWNGLRADEFQTESYAYLVTGQDFNSSDIAWDKCYQIDKNRYDEDPFIQLSNGDLLITKDGTIGKIAKVSGLDKPACLNSGIFVMKQKKQMYSQGYLYWLLCSSMLKDFNGYTSTGTTILHLYQNVFENMPMLVPSIEEQESIANYLDDKCSKIDNVIATQEKRVELLRELKQSIITRAVTRGIPSTSSGQAHAKMKDSGVEWIGEIPEHWEIIKVKHIAKITNGCDPKTEGYIPVYGSGAGSFKTCGEYKIGPCVLLGRKGATLHIPHYIEGKYWNVDTAFDVKTTQQFNLKLFYYLAELFDYGYYTMTTTLPSMTQTDYGNMKIPFPPLAEQQRIVAYIEQQTSRLDSSITKALRQIELLKEYKQSLITEVVTGKRKVC